MSELSKIVLTSSLTIFGGIVVFTMGQVIAKFLIEPIHEEFKLIGEITDSLIFYANVYLNPGTLKTEKMDEAQTVLRQRATQLMAKTHTIRLYKLWQLLKIVPKYGDIVEARKNLIGLSNSIQNGDPEENHKRVEEIEKLLHIKTGI